MAKSIHIEILGLEDIKLYFRKDNEAMTRAAKTAIRETGNKADIVVNKAIKKMYNFEAKTDKEKRNARQKKTLKNTRSLQGGNSSALEIVYSGKGLSLAHFDYSPKIPKPRAVVKADIKKNVKRVSYKAFVMHTGAKDASKYQYNVFERIGKERFPIRPVRTTSIPQMVINSDPEGEHKQEIADYLQKRLLKHWNYFRSKA